ncbi:hypothetical protein NBRC116589_13410 [Ruegeria sp. HU-ET01832]
MNGKDLRLHRPCYLKALDHRLAPLREGNDVEQLAENEHDMDDNRNDMQLVIRYFDNPKHERLQFCAKWAFCVKIFVLCQPHN